MCLKSDTNALPYFWQRQRLYEWIQLWSNGTGMKNKPYFIRWNDYHLFWCPYNFPWLYQYMYWWFICIYKYLSQPKYCSLFYFQLPIREVKMNIKQTAVLMLWYIYIYIYIHVYQELLSIHISISSRKIIRAPKMMIISPNDLSTLYFHLP